MNSVEDHYATLLAPIYVWMCGGIEVALSQGEREIQQAGLDPDGAGRLAIDLGSGFGRHAIPLARRGYRVIAVDSSSHLLDRLKDAAHDLPIEPVQSDLMTFLSGFEGRTDLILCMGDTLTHLQSLRHVDQLIEDASATLNEDGALVLSFRDYTHPEESVDRFISVRCDPQRSMTCFLEYSSDHVTVYDIIHESGLESSPRVSSYRKLRLAPDAIEQRLIDVGFIVRMSRDKTGMTMVVALKVPGRQTRRRRDTKQNPRQTNSLSIEKQTIDLDRPLFAVLRERLFTM